MGVRGVLRGVEELRARPLGRDPVYVYSCLGCVGESDTVTRSVDLVLGRARGRVAGGRPPLILIFERSKPNNARATGPLYHAELHD